MLHRHKKEIYFNTKKQIGMNTFKLLVKEQRVTEMERQVQALNQGAVSYDLNSGDMETEEEVYDRLIQLDPLFMHEFIMTRLCPRQRAELFERISVVNAYELNEMSEREYMAEYKFQLYNKYLSQQ
jgi:hypothetical protein